VKDDISLSTLRNVWSLHGVLHHGEELFHALAGILEE
jgi:hypothetical protein